jgi:hypothetical protein
VVISGDFMTGQAKGLARFFYAMSFGNLVGAAGL